MSLESAHFPYVQVEVRIDERVATYDALLDTGFDGDVALPAETMVDRLPNEYRFWTMADGSVVEVPAY